MNAKPAFFESASAFRAWLEKNHATASELLAGFYKRATGRPSMTWPESVDQALCFGWIDGVRRRIDDESYSIRFTPRKARSTWSAVNIGRAKELIALGLMRPAGLRAFEIRTEEKSHVYSYENAPAFAPAYEKRFRANKKAWEYFANEAPSYRRVATYWVMGAKREETRERRLARLIDDSSHHRRLGEYTLEKRTTRRDSR